MQVSKKLNLCLAHSWCSINASFFFVDKYARVGFTKK